MIELQQQNVLNEQQNVLNTIIHQEKAIEDNVFYESILLLNKRKNSINVNEKCIRIRHKNSNFILKVC